MMRWLDRSGFGLLSPSLMLLLAAFLAPLAFLVPVSFRPYVPGRGIGEGLTAEHYVRFFTDLYYLEIFGRTILLGAIVTTMTLLVGYPLAYFLARTKSRWRSWLTILVVFPLLLNLVVRTFGWIALLANRGLINETLSAVGLIESPLRLMFNFTGLLIGLTHIFLPFMVLLLVSAIQTIDRSVEEAARVLGASWSETFLKVTLPLSTPGILSGSILVFVLTISALVTPRLLGGPTYKVMSTLIYEQFMSLLNWPRGSAMATILTVVAIAIIALSGRFARRFGAR
jgi:putative spermidine/putrescine transport system permease protein